MNPQAHSTCAGCKFLRRKCTQECVFAPHFPSEEPQKFACVHRVYGASNISKLLNELNPSYREAAVKSLAYESEARLRDPIYGCVGLISHLQQKLKELQRELHNAEKELSTYMGPDHMASILQPQMFEAHQQHFNIAPSQYNMPSMMGNILKQGGPLVIHGPQSNHVLHQHMQQQQQQQMNQLTSQFAEKTLVGSQPHNEMLLNCNVQEQRQQQLQQQELLRFNSGDGYNWIGSDSRSGYNQMTMQVGDSTFPLTPSLALGTHEDPNCCYQTYQSQRGEEQQPIAAHTIHHQFQDTVPTPEEAYDSVQAQQQQQLEKPEGEDKIVRLV